MSKKKKIILGASISFIIIVISGFAFVISTTACGFSPGHRGTQFHKRGMPPFMHQEIRNFILWRLDQATKDLDLTKAQQQEYDHLKSALQGSMEKGIQTRLQIRTLIHSQMTTEMPDILAITQTVQTHLASISKMFDNNIALFNTFYASLDADQKNRITQKIKEKYNHHKKNYPWDER